MAWQKDFEEFKIVFNDFSNSLNRKDLSEKEQDELVDNLNKTVEKGWKALQKFMHQEAEEVAQSASKIESISKNGFASDLDALKQTFDLDQSIKLKHDKQYLITNEWEIREVVYPAFKDLHDFLEKHA